MNTKKILKMLIALFASTIIAAGCSAQNGNDSKKAEQSMEHSQHRSSQSNGASNDKENTAIVVQEPSVYNEEASKNLLTLSTKNVTRLNTDDPVELSVLVSQTVWPATHKENQPNGIILAPLENWQATLAAADLIHHPNNGPILFTKNNTIPNQVLNEIQRLNPLGIKDGTQIFVIGNLPKQELDKLKRYKVQQINETDYAALAQKIDQLYAEVAGKLPESVIIGSFEEKAKLYTIPAANWIAHMEEPILYVSQNKIPKQTEEALKKRKGKANIYILGPQSIISKEVEEKLKEFGKVTRISGDTPTQQSVAFATFKDKKTGFGWGLNNPGHGLSFVSTKSPEMALAAAPFSHLGKHAPLIWLENGELTPEVYELMATLKPTFENDPTVGPYNHAYLSGTEKLISYQTQGVIDEKLEIVPESGEGHGSH
jgi:putative cell wall-binding protein